ncbi:MAG: TetR/AcrR family transcriptional regulator [Subtercola sp.]|nr:TetR/AcrR family transcriptional regulator [Subtercola sp.]
MTTPERAPKAKAGKGQAVERRNRDKDVISSATSVMSERGYSATSIQEIADRVGVLKGSLYHYFSSKEELLFRILSESHRESEKITQDVAALGLEPLEELSEFLRRECIWFLTNVNRANIYFTESGHLTGDRLKQIQRSGREFTQHLQDLISAAQEKGQISIDLDPVLLTRYVLGSVNNVRAWPTRSGPSFSKEEMADAFVRLTRNALQATS